MPNGSLAPEFQHLTIVVVGEDPALNLISEKIREIKVFDVNWNALQKASAVLSGLVEFLVTFKTFEGGQPIIRIVESEVQAFHDLLHFVEDKHQLDISRFTVNQLIDLQKVADKFAVIDCMKFCNKELANLPITYKLAEFYLDPPSYICSNLFSSEKELAKDLVAWTYRDVERHWNDILGLSPPLFNVIMMDSQLEVQDEDTILQLCSQWASAQEGRREYLEENVGSFVRWPYLSIGQLSEARDRFLMVKEVLQKVDWAIEYHQDSAKYNQSVFTLGHTKFSKLCTQQIEYFLWRKRSSDLMYVERDYQRRPIRVNVGDSSEYSIYFELSRNHMRKLLLGQKFSSQEFCCCNTKSRFRLFSQCVGIESENYLGFYVRALENEDPQKDFTCKIYVFSKKAAKSEVKKDGYVLKHRENFRSGCAVGSDNLLGPSLTELINEEDSQYFVNGKIFIRVILDTPILTEELDKIIRKLLNSKSGKGRTQLTKAEIHKLLADAANIFLEQPNLLQLKAPIKICGDIQGQYTTLLRIFKIGGNPPSTDYLFLGGYVNHSNQNIETICLLLAFKIRYKDSFFLLRGSNECASMCQECGFAGECKRRFGNRIWETFVECFNCLPVAALVDDQILCMHGGLSHELENLDQINKIVRPAEVPSHGLLYDLLWADPVRDTLGWGKNERGATTFGADMINEFLLKHDLDFICRAHQVVARGYEFVVENKLITIFSAPNYLGKVDNDGAIMSVESVDKTLDCSFQVLASKK